MVRQPLHVNYLGILFSGHEELLMDHVIPLYGYINSASRTYFSGRITDKGNFFQTEDKDEISDCHIIAFHVLSGTFKSVDTDFLSTKLGRDLAPFLSHLSSPKSKARKKNLKPEILQFSRDLSHRWHLIHNIMHHTMEGNQLSAKGHWYCLTTVGNIAIRPENNYNKEMKRSWLCRNLTKFMRKMKRLISRIIHPGNPIKDNYQQKNLPVLPATEFIHNTDSRIPGRVNRKPKNRRRGQTSIISHMTYILRTSNQVYKVTEI